MTRLLAVLAALASLGPLACGKYGAPQRRVSVSLRTAVPESRKDGGPGQAAPSGLPSTEAAGSAACDDLGEEAPGTGQGGAEIAPEASSEPSVVPKQHQEENE